jgi:hypothetical protein
MRSTLFRFSLLFALLVAAITPAAHADALPPTAYAPSEARGDDPPADRSFSMASRRARQVSGLPWSRVWVERNLFRNRGR